MEDMKALLFIFIGGGAGSILRYLVGRMVASLGGERLFPLHTFMANALGCLLLGHITMTLSRHNLTEEWRLLLVVGVCGGFTTFSTFSGESLTLLRTGHHTMFLVYAAGSFLTGLTSVYAGMRLAMIH